MCWKHCQILTNQPNWVRFNIKLNVYQCLFSKKRPLWSNMKASTCARKWLKAVFLTNRQQLTCQLTWATCDHRVTTSDDQRKTRTQIFLSLYPASTKPNSMTHWMIRHQDKDTRVPSQLLKYSGIFSALFRTTNNVLGDTGTTSNV